MKFTMPDRNARSAESELLISWLLLCAAISVHVFDEATHHFLDVYNPTVQVLRTTAPWLPVPVFTFAVWITGLAVGIAVLLVLSPRLSRGSRWVRHLAYAVGLLMVLNGFQHIVGTILGHTVAAVRFPRPMPGFYSSPVLIVASLYMLLQLRNTRKHKFQA